MTDEDFAARMREAIDETLRNQTRLDAGTRDYIAHVIVWKIKEIVGHAGAGQLSTQT